LSEIELTEVAIPSDGPPAADLGRFSEEPDLTPVSYEPRDISFSPNSAQQTAEDGRGDESAIKETAVLESSEPTISVAAGHSVIDETRKPNATESNAKEASGNEAVTEETTTPESAESIAQNHSGNEPRDHILPQESAEPIAADESIVEETPPPNSTDKTAEDCSGTESFIEYTEMRKSAE
jgi:hypothetical protein